MLKLNRLTNAGEIYLIVGYLRIIDLYLTDPDFLLNLARLKIFLQLLYF